MLIAGLGLLLGEPYAYFGCLRGASASFSQSGSLPAFVAVSESEQTLIGLYHWEAKVDG